MKLFSIKFSLRSKLILVILLCCTIALLLNNAFIFSVETLDSKKNKVTRLFILADVLANNSTAAIQFSDKESAKEILQSSEADVSINHVVLFDEQCHIFAEYKSNTDNNKETPVTASSCSGERYSFYGGDDYLYISIPVVFKKDQIGTLFIKSGLNDLNKMFNRQLQIFSILFVVTLLIAFLLSFKLQKMFLIPIKNLLSAIRHITQNKDYSIQVKSHTDDELALLADEFNLMISEINQHDKLLSNQNQLLEQTVQKRTQELQTNLMQLKQAKEAAEIANKAKSDFLSHMSHDLRTPLNSLLGYVQILERKEDFPAKYLNEIKIIGQSSEYLLSLINDLLDLTKIESNKLELMLHTFNAREFISPIVEMFSNQSKKKELQFIYKIEDDLPIGLYGDENRIRRILSNLLENAFKYTEQGSIAFTVSYKDNVIVFKIKDSGCGINKENLQAIFEPFNQFSRKVDNDGVGLGLYITQYLVELMQGTLSIKSQLNKGTTCLLTLPLPARQYTSPALDKYETITGFQGDLKTVLVVDDKPYNLEVLKAMLEPLGFKVVCVNSGLACLEQLQKLFIDIILLDMVMPTINGIETCKRIHQLELSHQPKIIMITANAFTEDREQSLAVGCDDFLAKPVILNQLLEIFEKHLNLQWVYKANIENVKQKPFGLESLRVLVAEDNEICRLLMDQNLKEAGLEAVFAEEGNQALQMIQSSTFDCIILDYKMPHKTGVDIANYINTHETPNNQSYLVLMSALTSNEMNIDAIHAGFDEVLTKPIDFECLIKLLEAAYK